MFSAHAKRSSAAAELFTKPIFIKDFTVLPSDERKRCAFPLAFAQIKAARLSLAADLITDYTESRRLSAHGAAKPRNLVIREILSF